MLYKRSKPDSGTLRVNTTETGEMLENKVARIMKNNEPITDGAPIVYTERKDGVKPEHDIRTDRWDLAVVATDISTKGAIAKRQLGIKEREEKNNPPQQSDEPSQ